MYRFFRVLQRDTVNMFINPMWLFFGIAYPFLLTAVLGILTEGLYGKSITSYDYYGVTMVLYCALNAATFSANCFLEERVKMPNLRIVYAPVGKLTIPLSKILATFIYTGVFYTIAALLMQKLFGIHYGGENALYVWMLFLAVDFFCCAFGVIMCCIFKSEGVANQIISIVLMIFALLSGLFFPVASLGKKIAEIADLSPITQVSKTIFSIIYDQDLTNFLPVMVTILGLSAVAIVLCRILFNGEEFL